MSVTIDPMSIPVSEASPEILEIQGRHHATNAAYRELKKFLEPSPENEDTITMFGELIELAHINRWGESVVNKMQVIWLADAPNGGQLVFYRTVMAYQPARYTPQGYGIVNGDHATLQEHTPDEDGRSDADMVRAACQMICENRIRAGLSRYLHGDTN